MTDSIINFIKGLLRENEEKTGLSCFIIANKMGIEPSNYYKYREGDGNPTCKTIDKILEVVMDEQPEIMVRMLEEELEIVRAAVELVKGSGR